MASKIAVSWDRAESAYRDCEETIAREMELVRRALARMEEQEFHYRLLRANAATAQALVWLEVMGCHDLRMVATIEEIMGLMMTRFGTR